MKKSVYVLDYFYIRLHQKTIYNPWQYFAPITLLFETINNNLLAKRLG